MVQKKATPQLTPGTPLPAVGSGAPVRAISVTIFNNDSSLPTFATTVPTCAGHFRIVPVSVFRVEAINTVFITYPMHNWAPYWLFTMVYACVPHFNLWRGLKHPCSFQLRIALNLIQLLIHTQILVSLCYKRRPQVSVAPPHLISHFLWKSNP